MLPQTGHPLLPQTTPSPAPKRGRSGGFADGFGGEIVVNLQMRRRSDGFNDFADGFGGDFFFFFLRKKKKNLM
jgi:hypothetical protein